MESMGMSVTKKYFPCMFCLILLFNSLFSSSTHAADTLTSEGTLRNNETLVSAGGVFELGFFGSERFSDYQYLGIWLRADVRKVVWVDRENPTFGLSGCLQISSGNLVLKDMRQVPMIVNTEKVTAVTTITSATLLDNGNFVLKEADTGTIIWQSFDIPSDTFLPGMKLGLFGLNSTKDLYFHFLVSWISPEDPASGLFTLSVDGTNLTKIKVWRGDGEKVEVAFWNGHALQFVFENSAGNNNYNFSYQSNEYEAYYTFSSSKKYDLVWFVLTSTGNLDQHFMLDKKITSVSHTLCEAGGMCLTSVPSKCGDGGIFSELNGSFSSVFNSGSINTRASDCETVCKNNCSCTAFASLQNEEPGCQLYYGSKKDLMKIIEKGPGIIYIRNGVPSDDKKWKLWLAIVVPLASLLVLIPISLSSYLRRQKEDQVTRREGHSDQSRLFQMGSNCASPIPHDEARGEDNMELGRQKDHDLPFFSLLTIKTATDNFAEANKLGEGGFGPVYKAKLLEGQEIAVKRLSKISRQGSREFKNEVSVICKLQHRNLVRLLGCCIEAEESILVYEYMPNKSLDSFIFDSTKRALLDWRRCVGIIKGIAQGLLYLHRYSRLRIIHRDLKTSNILLDSEMNPKISDFGMARIFGDNDTGGRTNRVVGTFGYMSPEYAMDGLFSEKSDVFSFGVIILEIISCTKNIAFFETDHSLNLLGKAWNLWKEGNGMDLMDSALSASCSGGEVMRCIQMALLCVQERAKDRPDMSDVVSMLSNESIALPLPKEPAFLNQLNSGGADSSSSRQRQRSINDVTISSVHGR